MRRSFSLQEKHKPTRHHYPTEKQVRAIAGAQGPHAAAAAEAGGTLITGPELRIKFVGRGCSTMIGVIGTSGTAPCGIRVTDLRGQTTEHLCPHCSQP